MKVETGSFTANSTNVGIILEDDTMLVKSVEFYVSLDSTSSAEFSHGTFDGTNKNCVSTLVTSTKRSSKRTSDFAITHYREVAGVVTRIIAGNVTDLSEAGMIYLTFTQYNATPTIYYTAYGE